MSHHHYTEVEKQFCRDNIKSFNNYSEFADGFNRYFGTNITASQLSDLCSKRLGLSRKEFIRKTQFSNKYKGRQAADIGTERVFDGYVYVKVNDVSTGNSNKDFKTNWMFKQRYVWEQNFGKINDGDIIIFLDKDNTNFAIDNLYKVNRRVHAQMCRCNLYKENRDLTLMALKACEILDYKNEIGSKL